MADDLQTVQRERMHDSTACVGTDRERVNESLSEPKHTIEVQGATSRSNWKAYAWSLIDVAVCTAVAWGLYAGHFDLSNVVMVYLLGVVTVATRFGRGPAIFVSLLSVAGFDFFFVPPRFTLAVSDTQYLVTFAVMLVVAAVISALTNRVRQQAEAARRRERRTAALLALSRELAATPGIEQVLEAAARHVAEVFDSRAVILIPDAERKLRVPADQPTAFSLNATELTAAQHAFDQVRPVGTGVHPETAARALYLSLAASRGTVGVLGVLADVAAPRRDAEQLRLLEAFANQAALAIERARLAEEARAAWERVEAEFMRNTLLSSVSHDLRTPLAAITGAASSLVEAGRALPDEARLEMAQTIFEQSERMERLINNLLEMTRLESGGLRPRKEWQPLQEVIGSTLHHLARRLEGREVKVLVPADLPLVPFDAVAVEQVLANLIDNAIQYSAPGSRIEITASSADAMITVEVADRGSGLPVGAERRVFEKFFRAGAAAGSGSRKGIGLGLAICRGIVEAHGGTIWCANREGGGAVFHFTLPLEGTPPTVDPAEIAESLDQPVARR